MVRFNHIHVVQEMACINTLWCQQNAPAVSSTARCFKLVILFVSLHGVVLFSLCLCFALQHYFAIISDDERAGCFTLNVFSLSCGCHCSMSLWLTLHSE